MLYGNKQKFKFFTISFFLFCFYNRHRWICMFIYLFSCGFDIDEFPKLNMHDQYGNGLL